MIKSRITMAVVADPCDHRGGVWGAVTTAAEALRRSRPPPAACRRGGHRFVPPARAAAESARPADAQLLGLSVLVNNVLNKMPPLDRSYPGTSGSPYNDQNYNVNGRAMYIEAKYKFGAN